MIPWRRKWQPTPVFLPGEFHRQTTLVSYSPWNCKELDITECIRYICIYKRTHAVIETQEKKKNLEENQTNTI